MRTPAATQLARTCHGYAASSMRWPPGFVRRSAASGNSSRRLRPTWAPIRPGPRGRPGTAAPALPVAPHRTDHTLCLRKDRFLHLPGDGADGARCPSPGSGGRGRGGVGPGRVSRYGGIAKFSVARWLAIEACVGLAVAPVEPDEFPEKLV